MSAISSYHLLFVVTVLGSLPRWNSVNQQGATEAQFEKGKLEIMDLPAMTDSRPDYSTESVVRHGTGPLHESESRLIFDAGIASAAVNRTEYFSRSKERPAQQKGSVFGLDTRFALPSNRFITMFPFCTAVKLSNGCSGILLSPKHVLTAAHCLHDGKRYNKGLKKLKVGKIVKPSKNKRGKRKASRKKDRRNKKGGANNAEGGARGDLPYFKWVRARKFNIPQEWPVSRNSSGKRSALMPSTADDYAVIELRRSLGKEYMPIGVLPDPRLGQSGRRVHFSGYDGDSPNQMLYRFCTVQKQTTDLLYQYCDAKEGASGSGMYIRLYDRQQGTWGRKVIGIFSGTQQLQLPDGTLKSYNIGVRITPLKYAQICLWVKGDYSRCQNT